MFKEARMMHGARRLVEVCARVQPGERALVVSDMKTDPVIAQLLFGALLSVQARPAIIYTVSGKTDSGEPEPMVSAAMAAADVVFTAVGVSVTHTAAVQQVCARGGRVVALTQWTPEMMMGGGIDADFAAIEPRVRRVAAIWDKVMEERIFLNVHNQLLAYAMRDGINLAVHPENQPHMATVTFGN